MFSCLSSTLFVSLRSSQIKSKESESNPYRTLNSYLLLPLFAASFFSSVFDIKLASRCRVELLPSQWSLFLQKLEILFCRILLLFFFILIFCVNVYWVISGCICMWSSMAYRGRGRGRGGFSGGGGFGFAKQEPFVLFPVSFCCCSFCICLAVC